MHYTAINFADSVKALTGGGVSSHYLVPDPSDQSYLDAGFKDMRIFNLVDETERAWHAGVSYWAGRTNLNDTSIGIENVNLASDDNGAFTFPPYNSTQIEAVKALAINILQRYPTITPTNVVGHGDISAGRKSDPGSAFPWKELYEAGVGAWYDDETKEKYTCQFHAQGLPVNSKITDKLKIYGYDTSSADDQLGFKHLVRAFQLHFRATNYSGKVDVETVAILYALTEKYFGK